MAGLHPKGNPNPKWLLRRFGLSRRDAACCVSFFVRCYPVPVTKRRSKGAYMISAVAEMYGIHPQTLRLYEREGLLKPSRTEGNTRLYTDEDLERLEFILSLARDLGVNISGIAIILNMRERMEEMQRQMQEFVKFVQSEVFSRAAAAHPDPSKGAIVPMRRSISVHSKEGKR